MKRRVEEERLGKLKNLYNYREDIFLCVIFSRPDQEVANKKCVTTSETTEKTMKNLSQCKCECI